jgi:formylglycine-generating enzyme required for sulfatase activity
MVWIAGGKFEMGADNEQAGPDEFPKHEVSLSGFYMDETEVTNLMFAEFVLKTGYRTTAEKSPEQGSFVFSNKTTPPQWIWIAEANWKHPEGRGSTILDKQNHPVVHVSWFDANAYCKWKGKQLPTETQWEYASRGGFVNHIYPWGNDLNTRTPKCNYWQGEFPYRNDVMDGFMKTSPVKTFAPNPYGLYDMAGNVWEWCSDNYHFYYYSITKEKHNPQGPPNSFDPDEPGVIKKVLRGGSFLCSENYCSGYRVSRRMKNTPETAMEHIGFRCVVCK